MLVKHNPVALPESVRGKSVHNWIDVIL